jgi:hypothetical protein
MARSRRGSGCLILVLVLILILCGVGVIADRVAAHAVESRLADAISTNLKSNGTPAKTTKVDTEGFPFLTQVLSGQFDGGQVHLTGVTSPQGSIDKVDLTLKDVQVPRDVLSGAKPHDVTAANIVGTGRLSVTEVASRLSLPGLTLKSKGSALQASFPIEAPIIGSVPVTADVTPHLTNNTVTFDVANVTAAGISIPQEVITTVTEKFARPVVLAIPFSVKLDKVSAGGGYLNVTGSARNVTLVE